MINLNEEEREEIIKIRVEMTVDYMKVNIMINELNLFLQGAAML
jgi:hypothetical protein